MRRAAPIALAFALSGAGCHQRPLPPSGEELKVAEKLLAEARSDGGIGTDLVDAEMVERVRRIQLVRRTALDTFDKEKLLSVLAGEGGPDKQYPEAQRPEKQRERATRGMRAQAQGECKAVLDEAGVRARLDYLLSPVKGMPEAVNRAQEELGTMLRQATGARLDCTPGHIGMLMRRGDDGKLKVVDMWQAGAPPIQFDPDSPNQK